MLHLPPERDGADLQRLGSLAAIAAKFVEGALDRYKGNRRQAAAALNISTVTLWRKMKEYELDVSP